jgi:hypothetical protein
VTNLTGTERKVSQDGVPFGGLKAVGDGEIEVTTTGRVSERELLDFLSLTCSRANAQGPGIWIKGESSVHVSAGIYL